MGRGLDSFRHRRTDDFQVPLVPTGWRARLTWENLGQFGTGVSQDGVRFLMVDQVVEGVRLAVFSNGASVPIGSGDYVVV